ncbi:AAA family ATPase [Candidatus Woesearchaeota archaeon]|nr:AAA family ATPase [Candidatus Woesearchaeota archaeon]
MGELFENILSSDESIFLNPQFLDFDYQPKLVPFRESQQKYIATCIKPLLQRRNGKNIIILGKPGVGKTVSLRHVLNELKEEYSNEVYCLYINCWKRDTSFKIISEICQQINYKWTHNKNFDELMNSASEIINEKSAVIILDEADKLQDHNIIYNILEDFHRRCIILITNDNDFVAKVDDRIRSRLIPDLIEFKPYNYDETESILKQRTEYAFVPDVLEKEAFDSIIKKTFACQDIRAGLFLFKQSGEIAENNSSRKINLEYVRQAIVSLDIADLNTDKDTEAIINIIKENSGKTKGEIFKIYESNEGKSYRTFQRKLKELEDKKIISLKDEIYESGKRTIVNYAE